uniref:EF-hand domain-containing protein n=1 Tax=Globisporangium ultimum (strain ATCC 200006 / CBS 805.95 / DAOM BR144) TaxID=431595 RepID=K3X0G9_GLOUD
MELIQASFQASFDARVDRLSATELAELRMIFRYFDTDSDGAVSANQACRMFALLGLDVNPSYVQELEEVYMNGSIFLILALLFRGAN